MGGMLISVCCRAATYVSTPFPVSFATHTRNPDRLVPGTAEYTNDDAAILSTGSEKYAATSRSRLATSVSQRVGGATGVKTRLRIIAYKPLRAALHGSPGLPILIPHKSTSWDPCPVNRGYCYRGVTSGNYAAITFSSTWQHLRSQECSTRTFGSSRSRRYATRTWPSGMPP